MRYESSNLAYTPSPSPPQKAISTSVGSGDLIIQSYWGKYESKIEFLEWWKFQTKQASVGGEGRVILWTTQYKLYESV